MYHYWTVTGDQSHFYVMDDIWKSGTQRKMTKYDRSPFLAYAVLLQLNGAATLEASDGTVYIVGNTYFL